MQTYIHYINALMLMPTPCSTGDFLLDSLTAEMATGEALTATGSGYTIAMAATII